MAITITTYELSSDQTSINLVIDAGSGNTFNLLYFYKDGDYLTQNYIDLTTKLTHSRVENLTITLADLLITDSPKIKGIITFYAVATNASTATRALYNFYYIDLCLANMIINKQAQEGFNEISTVYLLEKAAISYLTLDITNQLLPQALNAYERMVAMCEKNPTYLAEIDTSITSGSGEFILNGTYIVNK